MNWHKPKTHYMESADGKWRISRAAVRHKTRVVMRYRLWERIRGVWAPAGTFETSEAAKTKAEEMK